MPIWEGMWSRRLDEILIETISEIMATDQVHARRSLSVYIPSCHPLMSIESPFDTIHPLLSSLVDVNILGGCAVSLTISGRRQIKPEISEIMATYQVHARRSLSAYISSCHPIRHV